MNEQTKDIHNGGVSGGGGEQLSSPLAEVPPLNPLVWPDASKYESFVDDVDRWADEAKVSLMGHYPQFYDQLEHLFDVAREKTLSHARDTGPQTEKYFNTRVDFELHGPLQELLKNTEEPSLPLEHSESVEVSEAPHATETGGALTESVVRGEITEVTPEFPKRPLTDREKALYGYSSLINKVKQNGFPVHTARSEGNGVEEAQNQKEQTSVVAKEFSSLNELLKHNPEFAIRNVEEPDGQEPTIPAHQHDAPDAIENVLAPEDLISVAQGEAETQEAEKDMTSRDSEPLEERVKRSILNGSFDLNLATGPQLEALLVHPDDGIKARAKEVLEFRASGHPLTFEHASDVQPQQEDSAEPVAEETPVVETPVPAVSSEAIQERPVRSPVTKEMVLETLGNGGEIPPIFLKKFMNDPEVAALVSAKEKVAEPTTAPEFKVEPSSSSDDKTEGDALAASILENVPEGDTLSEPIAVEDMILPASETPAEETPLVPQAETPEGGKEVNSHYKEEWIMKSAEEKKGIVDGCRLRFLPGKFFHVRHDENSEPEEWEVMHVKDDGLAFVRKGDLYKNVYLLELMELNPEITPEEIAAQAKAEEDLKNPKVAEEQLSPLEQRAEELAGYKSKFDAMTKEEQETFVSESKFLFSIGRPQKIKRTNGDFELWTLLAIGADGMAHMQSSDGTADKMVPLMELHDLNVVSGGEEIHESFEKVEQSDETPEKLNIIASQFEREFGIKEKDLMGIAEFAELSEGQQVLVRNELSNYAVSQIKTDALKAYREKYQSLKAPLSELEQGLVAKQGMLGGLARVAVGVAQLRHKEMWQKAGMSIFKRKILVENEKEIAEKMSSGEVDHSEFIRELSLQAKEGPDVVIEGHNVRLQFLKAEDIGGRLSEGALEKVSAFNAIAGQFAEMPHAWKERGATKENRGKYDAKELAYRTALDNVLQVLKEKGTDESALIDVNELDRRITFTQFFNAHPEAAEQLANIKNQNVWGAALLDIAKTRGATMALGGSIRTIGAFVASQVFAAGSLIAAPLAGAATGGYMGHKRATGELKERELLAKSGVKDTSSEALNVVPATVREIDAEGNELVRGGLVGKLEGLMQEIENAPESELGNIHEQLARRVEYTQTKIREGLVDYGDKSAQIKNQSALLRALARAKALSLSYVEPINPTAPATTADDKDQSWRKDNRTVEQRLADILKLHEQNISESQKAYVIKTTKQAAMYGAVFAGAGALVADIVRSGGGVVEQSIDQLRSSNVGGSDTAVLIEQSATPPTTLPPSAPLETVPSVSPSSVLPESTPGIATNMEIARTLREGWRGGLSEKAVSDPVFARDYVRGMGELTGRTPQAGLSNTEMNALLATDMGTTKNAAHLALIEAMRKSPNAPLSDQEVARIMVEHHVPTSLGATVAPSAPSGAAPQGEAVPSAASYEVKGGDTMTRIMKEQIPALRGLSSAEQENVIQNLLQKLSAEEIQKIGIPSANQIVVGQRIDVQALNEILATKQVGGESLIAHAQQIHGASRAPAPIPAVAETTPPVSQYSEAEVSKVAEGILNQKSAGGAPEILAEGNRTADAKAYSEYMNTTDSAEKEKIAEVIGSSRKEMDARIAEQLKKELEAKVTPSGGKEGDAVPLPIPKVVDNTPTPGVERAIQEVMVERPRAEMLSQEYLLKDMTDVRTGKLAPLWLEMKQYSATEILTIKQERVDPVMWEKILAMRKYIFNQGLTKENQIQPLNSSETLEAFLRRGHTQHVMEFGERKAPGLFSRSTPAPIESPVPNRVPQVPQPVQGEVSRLPRYDNTGTFDQGRGGYPDAESRRIVEAERASGLYEPRQYKNRELPPPETAPQQGGTTNRQLPDSGAQAPRTTPEPVYQVKPRTLPPS